MYSLPCQAHDFDLISFDSDDNRYHTREGTSSCLQYHPLG
jgi:hypothetical protein